MPRPVPPVAVELALPFLLFELLAFPPPAASSATLRSRKPAQRSARDSRLWEAEVGVTAESVVKNSVLRDGVLGVRWKGDMGSRRLLLPPPPWWEAEAPGRASPACSRCSSVHPSRPAMICRIWNFFGSERSSERNWRK